MSPRTILSSTPLGPIPLGLCLPAVLLAGCSPTTDVHVILPPPEGPPVYEEIEPNDSPYAPDFIGSVSSGTHFFVDGHVQAPGGFDVFDHFEFVADEATGIDFYLEGLDPFADLDLCIWDPDLQEIVACFDSPWNPEEGSFVVDYPGKVFQLVIEAYGVDSHYSLELIGYPYPYGPGGDGAPAPSGGSGISFPEGLEGPWKEKHRPGAPPVDVREVIARDLLMGRSGSQPRGRS